jgi:hypothetical protein
METVLRVPLEEVLKVRPRKGEAETELDPFLEKFRYSPFASLILFRNVNAMMAIIIRNC